MDPRLSATASILAFVVGGCGGDETSPPPTGRSYGRQPPDPTIVIVTPRGPVQAKAAEKIPCAVTIALSEGGDLPTFVEVKIVKGERSFMEGPMTWRSKGPNGHLYEAKQRAPRIRGSYQLKVDASYWIDNPDAAGGGRPRPGAVPRQHHIIKTGPTVEVVQ